LQQNFQISLVPHRAAVTISTLHEELSLLDSITKSAPNDSLSANIDNILLTGASGFVGAFLLDELLRATKATVHCIVRAASTEEALERIKSNAQFYGVELDLARVTAVSMLQTGSNIGRYQEIFPNPCLVFLMLNLIICQT
jgi:hypothetical protein